MFLLSYIFFPIILVFVYILWEKYRRPKNYPPGPINWFGIGSLIAMRNADKVYPHEALRKLAKKYGDIMCIDLGMNLAIVFSKYEDMVEIFTKEEFLPKYKFPQLRDRSYGKDLGLLFSSNDVWYTMRRFSENSLRTFGFRKSQVLETILEEGLAKFSASLVKTARENNGIVRFDSKFAAAVAKVIWNLTFGFESKECDDLIDRMLATTEDTARAVALNSPNFLYPFLGKLLPKVSGYTQNIAVFKEHQLIVEELIAESNKRRTDEGDAYNFVQAFQNEIEKSVGNSNTHFTDHQLIMLLVDLFLAGSETTNHMLGFTILHLVRNPEMQEKIYEEIAQILPNEYQMPTYADAQRMPYTQAFILEIFRFCNIVPIPIPRTTSVDYTYKGFIIPKGSCVMYSVHCVFNDQEYWGDPENFRPERFIDLSGNLTKTERMIMFGLGKRICLGDVLAKQTAFVFLAGLVKKFKFEQVPDQDPPSAVIQSSFTSRPFPFDALVTPRRHN